MKTIVTNCFAILCMFVSNINAQELTPFAGNSKRPFLIDKIRQDDLRRVGAELTEQQVMGCFVSNLTPEQRSAIKTLVLAKDKQDIRINNKLNEKRVQLQTLESSDKPNIKSIHKIIDEIGALIVSQMKVEAECKQKIRNILTEEQRVEFDLNRQ